MKRRIFMLLMAVVMLFGMSLTVFADEVKYYEGVGNICIYGEDDGRRSVSDAKLEYSLESLSLTYSIDGIEHSLVLTSIAGSSNGVNTSCDVEYDGVYKGIQYSYENAFIFSADKREVYIKLGAGDLLMDGYLELEEVVENVETHQISTGFTGTSVSDRGDYNLYIAGYFSKDLTNGTHVLALNDITSQTIAVVAHNNANGVNRNMNQSTIEEMTVTVSGGAMTEMIIRGRVQTDGGTLDRYTATINP